MDKKRALAVIVAVSVAAYANILGNGFVFDDSIQIVDNWWIRDASNLWRPFVSNVWGFLDDGEWTNYYRPIVNVLYAGIYKVSGLKPWGYHLASLLLNIGVCAAVFLVISKALNAFSGEEAASDNNGSELPALLGALVFALHPVHSEAVAFASAMAEPLFSLFGLFALYFHMDGIGSRRRFLSAFFFTLALLSKETAVIMLPIMVIYDHCLGSGLLRNWRRYVPYLVITAAYMAVRTYSLGGFAPNISQPGMTAYHHVINIFPLFAAYLWKLVAPMELKLVYVIKPVKSIFEWKALLGAAVTACYAVFMARAVGAARFALAVAALPLLPVLYLPALGDSAFAERYLYLSVAGLALLAAWFMTRALRHGAPPVIRRAAAAAMALVLIVYGIGTLSRNGAWSDDITIWTDTVRKLPDSPAAHYGLASAYIKDKRYEEALAEYEAMARLDPSNAVPILNTGIVYLLLGMPILAEHELKAAVELKPEYAAPHYNLGILYEKTGRSDEAIAEFTKVIKYKPRHKKALNILGSIYLERHMPEVAAEFLREAIEIDQYYADAHYNLGLALGAMGRINEARAEMEMARRFVAEGHAVDNEGVAR